MRKVYALLIVQFLVIHLVTSQVVITSFSPKKGSPATLVTINGSGFNATASNNIVYFGATRGIVQSATTNSINVFVPVGATYRPITVYNIVSRQVGYSKGFFIPTFSPKKGNISSADFLGKVDFIAATATKFNSLAVCDFFLDGKSEMITSVDLTSNLNNKTVFTFNNTSVTGAIDSTSITASNSYAAGPRPQAVNYGDMDLDGMTDIVSAVYGINRVNLQSGNLTATSTPSVAFGPIDVAVCDIDLDGKPDIITANALGLGISVLRNTNSTAGIFSFAASVDIVSGFQPIAMGVGDIDGDGKEDIVLANSNTDSTSGITVLRNTSTSGTISFAAAINFTSGPNPKGISLADIDGDDKLDVIVSNQKGNTISILRNISTSGNIALDAKVNFATGTKPKSIGVGDLNGDGKVDVVVGNTKNNNVSVFQNTAVSGTIDATSLAAPFLLSTGTFPAAVTIADLDGDGRPDIETANYNANTISVIKNEPTGLGAPAGNVVAQSMEDRYAQFLQSGEKGLQNKFNASIYPNPVKDVATLSFDSHSRPVAINVTDVNGHVLWASENVRTNILQIPVNKFAAGLYFVSITDHISNVTLKLVRQ